MNLDLYQVDAFSERCFAGNPAAVCPLASWLPDVWMQSIAAENNLSDTAFLVAVGDRFEIRWFTPQREVNLCGHATLAAAYVLFHELGYAQQCIQFQSKSGMLKVQREGDWLVLDFPAQPPTQCDIPACLQQAFGATPRVCCKAEDYLLVFDDAEQVVQARPDLVALQTLDLRGVIITASAREYDFITRFFAPKYGVDEDPVTGSAFTQLIPYWHQQTGKTRFFAKQVSARGGELRCEWDDDRVFIAGQAALYMKGRISLPANGLNPHNIP